MGSAVTVGIGGATNGRFGSNVALSGDGTTAVVGAEGVSQLTGEAYVFTTSGGGSWSQVATLDLIYPSPTFYNNGKGSFFGGTVSISDDGANVVVGASDTHWYSCPLMAQRTCSPCLEEPGRTKTLCLSLLVVRLMTSLEKACPSLVPGRPTLLLWVQINSRIIKVQCTLTRTDAGIYQNLIGFQMFLSPSLMEGTDKFTDPCIETQLIYRDMFSFTQRHPAHVA